MKVTENNKKRTGECKQCGRCCSFARLYQTSTIREKFILFLTHSRKTIKQMIKNNFICPNLRQKISGKYYCDIHKTRPDFCRKYPETENDLIDDKCGYKFIN